MLEATSTGFNPEYIGILPRWFGRIVSSETWQDNIVPHTFSDPDEIKGWAFRYKVRGAIIQSGADINMTTLQCFAGCQGNTVMVIFSHSNFEDLQNDNSTEWAKVYDKYNEIYGVKYESDIAEFESSLTLGGFGRYSGTMVFKPEMSSPQNLD